MRIKRLDILRCVAVLLVLVYHGEIVPIINRIGWIGVDLFFVLSGFLISGLLYSEFKQRGTIGLRRFFIRRGLKIYPAFYVMIAVTFLARHVIHLPNPARAYLNEGFFLQNYFTGMWQHTWSLGVEEHFYIFLPIFLLVLMRFSRAERNPFGSVPWAFAFFACLCLLLRAATIYFTSPTTLTVGMVMNATHERMDSLFFGVVLGYLWHFHSAWIESLFNSSVMRLAIGTVTLIFLSCCFLPRENHFLLTFGLTFLYLGFGGLLLMTTHIRNAAPSWLAGPAERLGTVFAFVGTYSYSIYLWHIPFQAFAAGVVRRMFHVQFDTLGNFGFYLIGSIVFGVMMARLIEFPVLRLRDRIFPAEQSQPVEVTASPEIESAIAATSRQL